MAWDSWEPVLWAIFFLMDVLLIGSNLCQLVCLLDLEADYMNPYESSTLINKVVIPEMVLNGVFCALFLMTGHWFMFLIALPVTFYNMKLYMTQKHLIDVTEVFRFLREEKKHRIIKLAFYLLLFILIVIRTFIAGTFSNMLSVLHSNNEGFDIRSMILEY